jgi:hypothetical protein
MYLIYVAPVSGERLFTGTLQILKLIILAKKIGLEQFFEGGYKLGAALWMLSGIWFQSVGADKLNRVPSPCPWDN